MLSNSYEKLFWLIVVFWFLLYMFLLYAQFNGNSDMSAKTEILRYFSQAEIDSGKDYALFFFRFKAANGILFMTILLAALKLRFFERIWVKCAENDFIFVIVFFLIIRLLSFPNSFVFGHWREVYASFTEQSFFSWLIRYFKSFFIGITIETLVVLAAFAVIRCFPQKWPMLLPCLLALVAFVGIFLMPLIITPVFYNQTPLEEGALKDKLLEISKKAGIQTDEIYVIDESRYSKHTNAYFTGIGPFKRIVLYDTLLKQHTQEEIALIFAHEAGHWKNNDMAWGLFTGFLGALAASFLYCFLYDKIRTVEFFGLENIAAAKTLPFLFVVYFMGQLFFAPLESQISQYMERRADYFALKVTGLNEIYKNAQIKLAKINKSDLLPHSFRVFWLYTHPPVIDRIKMADTVFQEENKSAVRY